MKIINGQNEFGWIEVRTGVIFLLQLLTAITMRFLGCLWHIFNFSCFFWCGPMGELGTPLQYSCLENPMDGGAWWAAVHGVAKSRTQLSDFTFTFHFHALEKEMATHSSVLAWRIPGMEELSGLPFMGSHRVGHDWSGLAVAAVWENLLTCLFKINILYYEQIMHQY